MNKFLPIFLSLSLLCLVGCGDSDSGNEGGSDREWLINDLANDDDFPGDREEAECYIDTVSESSNVSYAEMRAWDEEGPENPSPQLFAAILGSLEPCGIELESIFE